MPVEEELLPTTTDGLVTGNATGDNGHKKNGIDNATGATPRDEAEEYSNEQGNGTSDKKHRH